MSEQDKCPKCGASDGHCYSEVIVEFHKKKVRNPRCGWQEDAFNRGKAEARAELAERLKQVVRDLEEINHGAAMLALQTLIDEIRKEGE